MFVFISFQMQLRQKYLETISIGCIQQKQTSRRADKIVSTTAGIWLLLPMRRSKTLLQISSSSFKFCFKTRKSSCGKPQEGYLSWGYPNLSWPGYPHSSDVLSREGAPSLDRVPPILTWSEYPSPGANWQTNWNYYLPHPSDAGSNNGLGFFPSRTSVKISIQHL